MGQLRNSYSNAESEPWGSDVGEAEAIFFLTDLPDVWRPKLVNLLDIDAESDL